MFYFIFSLLLFCFPTPEHPLEKEIQNIIQGQNATIGVAVISDNDERILVNDTLHYPLMSVYKFHLALAVLDHLEKNGQSLETKIHITPGDLLPDTYSPLRDKRPQGNFDITIRQLLEYSVAQSDNNACDILFRYTGGPRVTEQYIRNLGITGFFIEATEEEMHRKSGNPYVNWTRPSSAAELVKIFMQKTPLSAVHQEFLKKTMISTVTGPNKLKGGLPAGTVIGHKTGNSDRNEAGVKAADNDLGFVRLPNGKEYYIAVFVMDSKESDTENAQIIAQISNAVYNYFNR